MTSSDKQQHVAVECNDVMSDKCDCRCIGSQSINDIYTRYAHKHRIVQCCHHKRAIKVFYLVGFGHHPT